jgi:hypothetical protein
MAPAFAQKGSLLYYGSLGGAAQGGGLRHTSLFVNSGLGYQLSDHLTLGVQGGLSHYRTREPGIADISQSNYAAGIFSRYTANLGKRLFVYAQADASYLGHAGKHDGNGVGVDLLPGVGLNVGRNWALNVNMNVLSFRGGFHHPPGVEFNMGQGYRFGIQKTFGGKHKAEATPAEK